MLASIQYCFVLFLFSPSASGQIFFFQAQDHELVLQKDLVSHPSKAHLCSPTWETSVPYAFNASVALE